MAASQSSAGFRYLIARLLAGKQDRTAIFANAFGPADLRIGLGGDYLAIGSVQCIEEAIAISLKDRLDGRAVFLEVDQHCVLGRVPIMDVVRSELIMPLQ